MRLCAVPILLATFSNFVTATPIPVAGNSQQSSSDQSVAAQPSATPRINPHISTGHTSNQTAASSNNSSTKASNATPATGDSKSEGGDMTIPIVVGSVGGALAISGLVYWRYEVNKNAAADAKATLAEQAETEWIAKWEAYDAEVFNGIGMKQLALTRAWQTLWEENSDAASLQQQWNDLGKRMADEENAYRMRIQARQGTDVPPLAGSDEYLMDHTADLFVRYPALAQLEMQWHATPHESELVAITDNPVNQRLEEIAAHFAETDPQLGRDVQTMAFFRLQNAKKQLAVQQSVTADFEATELAANRAGDQAFTDAWRLYRASRSDAIVDAWRHAVLPVYKNPGLWKTSEVELGIRDMVFLKAVEDVASKWNEEAARRMNAGELPVSSYRTDQSETILKVDRVAKAFAAEIKRRAEIAQKISNNLASTNQGGSLDAVFASDAWLEAKAKSDRQLGVRINEIIEELPYSVENSIYRQVWTAIVKRDQLGEMTNIDPKLNEKDWGAVSKSMEDLLVASEDSVVITKGEAEGNGVVELPVNSEQEAESLAREADAAVQSAGRDAEKELAAAVGSAADHL